MNPYSPGDDEYDAYEAALTGPSIHYVVLEAENHVALAELVSSAIRAGMDTCGGPFVGPDAVWYQAVSCKNGSTYREWAIDRRFGKD